MEWILMEQMQPVFEEVKQMALSAAIVIPVVLNCRFVLRGLPRRITYLLWGIVALRLLCPTMLSSEFSVFRFSGWAGQRQARAAETGERWRPGAADRALWTAEEKEYGPEEAGQGRLRTVEGAEYRSGRTGSGRVHVVPEQVREWYSAGETDGPDRWCLVWLAGVSVMLCYAAVSCVILRRRLRFATKRTDGVYESEAVDSPFVFGFFRPVIYIPYGLAGEELTYILAHERCHVRRRDYLARWLATFLLAVYWFHPLVWISYFLMSRDMEMSCDEYVLRGAAEEQRREYGMLLLKYAGRRERIVLPSFGDNGTRRRILHVLRYKRATTGSAVAASLFLAAVAAMCLTDARVPEDGNGAAGGESRVAEEQGGPVRADSLDGNVSGDGQIQQAAGEARGRELSEDRQAAAAKLYAARCPYIGDAPAVGRLLATIREVLGEQGVGYTIELQTEKEPYALIIHFEEPVDEDCLWKTAVLFMALTGNGGQMGWDYTVAGKTDSRNIFLSDINTALNVDDIKEYGESGEKVLRLLELLDTAEGQQIAMSIGEAGGKQTYTMKDEAEIRELLSMLRDGGGEADTVLISDTEGGTAGLRLWEQFYEKIRAGVPADLTLAYGDRPAEDGMSYTYVSYDGEEFYVLADHGEAAGEARYVQGTYRSYMTEEYEQDGEAYLNVYLHNDSSVSCDELSRKLTDSSEQTGVWLLLHAKR